MAEAVRDYGKLALDVIRLVGGKENITSAARCATRLRLVLKDTPTDAEEKIKALPGVITVVQKQGQFQVVIGNHVGDVFEVVSRELKLEEKEGDQPAQKESLLSGPGKSHRDRDGRKDRRRRIHKIYVCRSDRDHLYFFGAAPSGAHRYPGGAGAVFK